MHAKAICQLVNYKQPHHALPQKQEHVMITRQLVQKILTKQPFAICNWTLLERLVDM